MELGCQPGAEAAVTQARLHLSEPQADLDDVLGAAPDQRFQLTGSLLDDNPALAVQLAVIELDRCLHGHLAAEWHAESGFMMIAPAPRLLICTQRFPGGSAGAGTQWPTVFSTWRRTAKSAGLRPTTSV